MRKHCVAALVLAGLLTGLAATAGPASAADSAVVLTYDRFGDDDWPGASVRLDQLDANIAELKSGGYAVLPLSDIVAALAAGRPLPDKAVAITIDAARAGAYTQAWPRLKAANLPFTLFVATDLADQGAGDGGAFMDWSQIRELAASGLVGVGSLGAGYLHLGTLPAADVAADLGRARDRFVAELGRAPDLLAWPFGEASAAAMDEARRQGFTAAFGEHSGVAWSGGWNGPERYFLPRFGLNQAFAEPDRFRLAVRALPLPAIEIAPADPLLTTNPPAFGFTVTDEAMANGLACYASSEGRLSLERLGPRVEIRAAKPFPPGRVRLNCTIPSLDGRWRWFGWQFSVP
jgi:peptidoglycan/xylan/chitin deacetylase (PgdA/CDA1 family)